VRKLPSNKRRIHHPRPATAPPEPYPSTESGVAAVLREQLRTQEQRYETEIADLKAENERLKRALAAAHGELQPWWRHGELDRSRRGDTVTDNAVPQDETQPPNTRG
jgi:hypothetical protein